MRYRAALRPEDCSGFFWVEDAPGFEPETLPIPSGCATGLRYAPKIGCGCGCGCACVRVFAAVKAGFEPAVPLAEYVGLANRWFQPLTHFTKP